MSSLIATVSKIENSDGLHIVQFDHAGETISMVSLELGDSIEVGTKVKLTIKPSHIAIAKNLSGELSYSNQLAATIKEIENGELLSSLKLDYLDTTLEAIITLKSTKKMDLKVGDSITALIKASEVSIGEVLDG